MIAIILIPALDKKNPGGFSRAGFFLSCAIGKGGTHVLVPVLSGLFSVLGNLIDVERQHVVLVSVGNFLGQPI